MFGASQAGGGAELGWMLDGAMAAQVTAVLARLGVPDRLAGGPRTAAELAGEVGARPGELARVLAAANVFGLVASDEEGRYTLTATGDLLRSDATGSARNLAAGFLSPPLWACFGKLGEIVRTGQPPDPGAPGGIYDYFGNHPEEARWFARAMGRVTSILTAELAAARFRPLASGRIVDVGGSSGTLLAYLLQATPGSTGVLFDRAEALAEAPAFLASMGVADRAELVPGDFMREVPAGGDLYVLCQVLHNWDDELGRALVGNCHRAARPGSSLLVIDYVLPDGPEPSLAHLMDLIMLMVVGGRERTRPEHEALMASAGYTLARDTPLEGVLPWHALEFQRE
jgi:hypothetical protein